MADYSPSGVKKVVAPEKRGWLRGPHGVGPGGTKSVVLDLTKFAALITADGYIPSGTVVAKITASGLYGPYDNSKSDGTETAAGLLFGYEAVATGQTRGLNAIVIHANVDPARLPFASGAGSLDAAAQAELPHIITA